MKSDMYKEDVRNTMNKLRITVENGIYCLTFGYKPEYVDGIKALIPAGGRSWDNQWKRWKVESQYKAELERIFGVTFPPAGVVTQDTLLRMLTVHYIGQCKERSPGNISAMAYLDSGTWGAIFSENVLRAWFEDVRTPDGSDTLYAILGAHMGDDDAAIKSAYRRMAKQWHPDVCREPNAHETFLRIREAYDILINTKLRARYDAGIQMTAHRPGESLSSSTGYRSPLRCGFILCEGHLGLTKFMVSKIISWDDITDNQGRSMVTSWIMGDDKPLIRWA